MNAFKRFAASVAIVLAVITSSPRARGENGANPCIEDYRSNNCDGVSMTARWVKRPGEYVCLPSIASTGVCWEYSSDAVMSGEIQTTIYYTNCAPATFISYPSYTCNWTFVGGNIRQAGDGCEFAICTNFLPGEYVATINVIGDCGMSTSLVTTTKVVGVKFKADPYIGIDATPSNGAISVTNGMTAEIEVVPASVAVGSVLWSLEPTDRHILFTNGEVTIESGLHETIVESNAPSASYKADSVTAILTAGNCGLSASTNFTVVLVDVVVDGKGETEEVVPGSQRCADCENPADTISVDVSILPTALPTADKVVVSCTGLSNFFEDAQFKIPVDTNGYPVGTFKRAFYIRVTNACAQPKLTVTAVHKESGASDLVNVGYELADVDVDSTNRHCAAPADTSDEADAVELQAPGKVIAAQTVDAVQRVKLPKHFAVSFAQKDGATQHANDVRVSWSEHLKLYYGYNGVLSEIPKDTDIPADTFFAKAPYFVEGVSPDQSYEGESWITFKALGCEDKVALTSLSIGKPYAIDNDSRLSAGTKKILKTDILPAQPMPHALVWWTSNRFNLDRRHKVEASIVPLANDTAELRIGEESGSGIIRIYVARQGTDSNCIYSYADAYVGCQSCVESCGQDSHVVDVDQLVFESDDPNAPRVNSFAPGAGAHPVIQSLDGYSLGMTSGGSAGLIAVVTGTDGRGLTAVCSLSKDVTEIDGTVAVGSQTIATYSGAAVSFASGKSYTAGIGAGGAYSWSEIEGTSVLRRTVYTPTATGWESTDGSDAIVVTRAAQDIVVIATNVYRYTITQKNADGSICGKSESIRTLFPWGEAVTQDIVDPEGAALTTEYSYQSDTNLPGYGRVRQIVNADGSWQKYEYDGVGRVTNALSSWLDEPVTADPSAVKRTVTSYDLVAPEELAGAAIDTNSARSVIEFIAGVEVGRTYSASYLDSTGMEVRVSQRCTTIGAAFNAAGNLTTVSVSYPSNAGALLAGRTAWVRQPEGRLDTYGYEAGNFATNVYPAAGVFTPNATGAYRRTTVTHGLVGSPAGVANKTTQERSIADDRGLTLLSEQYVYTGTGYERIGWTAYSLDAQGRVVKTWRSNGALSESFWTCCNKWKDVDEVGNETLYYYDEIKRLTASVRNGISNATVFNGCGLPVRQTQSADGMSLTTSNAYDLAGRLIAWYDAARLRTLTGFGAAGRVTTNITSAGGLEITEKYTDGQVKAVTGSGVMPRFHTYGVYSDGSRWTEIQSGFANSPRWERTVTDIAERTLRSERPGFGGVIITNEFFYDGAGRQWKSLAPESLPSLTEFNELGEVVRQGFDVNGNGLLDPVSNDRITASTNRYVKLGGDWWEESVSSVFASDGNPTATPVSRSLRKLTGLGTAAASGVTGIVTAESVTFDIRGNGTTNLTCVDRAARTVIALASVPHSMIAAMAVTEAGNQTRQRTTTGLVTTNGYDALGRRVSQTDPRTGTSWTHYDGRGYIDYVLDAATNKTSYGYDSSGRRWAVTNALGQATYRQFDAQGRVTNTWGATYPVSYSFDQYGHMTTLTTYREEGAGGDTTSWRYDEATGLMTNKVYADGKGPIYMFTLTGRMSSRKWARGVTTDYAYDSFGALTNINYSDATPAVSYAYDRIGRQTVIIDGSGARGFRYNTELELYSETNAMGEITRRFDTSGRPTGLGLGPDFGVGYGYDVYGRLVTVTSFVAGASSDAHYGYLSNSDLVAQMTNSVGLVTTYAYEGNRNYKIAVTNRRNSTLLSSFDYAYDTLERITNRVDYGSTANSFEYNVKSELIDAKFGTRHHDYSYDDSGNRLAFTNGADVTTYGANQLNQYSVITTGMTHVALVYDDDGNLVDDGERLYSWDAENRLTNVTMKSDNSLLLYCRYDYMSRRFLKASISKTNLFTYDGWNMASDVSNSGSQISTNYYVWGPDLSQTQQGAGGVGGLLVESLEGTLAMAAHDANGNLTELVDSEGNVRAHYEYDGFGNISAQSGNLAAANPFRFWTKYTDNETGLVYHRFRYYSPEMGRWHSRDPLAEDVKCGICYTLLDNNPMSKVDPGGREAHGAQAASRRTADKSGPDVTMATRLAMTDIRNTFRDKWNSRQKCIACQYLIHVETFLRAWDIEPIAHLGMNGYFLFNPPASIGVGKGERTVQFRRSAYGDNSHNQVYYASAVNYVEWGLANRLCFDFFQQFDRQAALTWSLSHARLSAMMYKDLIYPMADILARDQALEFTSFGYDYTGNIEAVSMNSILADTANVVAPGQRLKWAWQPFQPRDDQ